MAQLASALIFMLLFVGCGAALQRLIADHLAEVVDALASLDQQPATRAFRVTVRPTRVAAVQRATF